MLFLSFWVYIVQPKSRFQLFVLSKVISRHAFPVFSRVLLGPWALEPPTFLSFEHHLKFELARMKISKTWRIFYSLLIYIAGLVQQSRIWCFVWENIQYKLSIRWNRENPLEKHTPSRGFALNCRFVLLRLWLRCQLRRNIAVCCGCDCVASSEER